MFTDARTGRVMASFEEMALYNMVLVEDLSELLIERVFWTKVKYWNESKR